jgi:phosphoglycolate phosphatase
MSVAAGSARPAVIFDLDGTLVDTGADIAAAANVARQASGLEPLPAAVVTGYVGNGVQRLLERVLGHDLETGRRRDDVPAAAVAAGLARFAEHYAAHLLDCTALYPGIAELLAALRDRPLFLATNKPRRFTLAILAGLGLDDRFRRVVAGDDVTARKPDPAHLAACLAGTDLPPREVVVVGDSPNDVLAARGLGCRVVGVTWGLVPVARLAAAEPDALVDDARALARELGAAW